MSADKCFCSARFLGESELIAWSPTSIAVFSMPDYATKATVDGKEFSQAVAFNGIIGAVAKGASPPFTQFFLQLYQQNGALLKSIEFPDRILSLMVTAHHLFVCVPRVVQVFDIKSFKAVATINSASGAGILDVREPYVAFPDESNQGYVSVVSTSDFSLQRTIPCHNGRIAAIALGPDGILMTASEKGTVVRVFDASTGHQLQELRRGYTRTAIEVMAVNDQYRVVCSSTTIHVFNAVGNHMCIQPQAAPVACLLKDNIFKVVFHDGAIVEYSIDELMTNSVVYQYQIHPQLKQCTRRQ